MGWRRRTFVVAGTLVAFGLGVGIAGSARTTRLASVTRTTSACPEAVWAQFEDIPRRTRWDDGLDWIRLDGLFEQGRTGEVKLRDQPVRSFELIEVDGPYRYTDRFLLPAGTHIDFAHRVRPTATGSEVTFVVTMRGPTSLPVSLFVGPMLEKELPAVVEKLVSIAESDGRC